MCNYCTRGCQHNLEQCLHTRNSTTAPGPNDIDIFVYKIADEMSCKIDIGVMREYNLIKICNWKCPNNVAIEHHTSSENSFLVTYSDICKIHKGVKKILTSIKSLSAQYIGISSDIPIFCIPSLILGILSSGHAFVYVSTELQDLLLRDTKLNTEYVIVPKSSCRFDGGRIIRRFTMHKQSLELVKISKKEGKQPTNLENNDVTNGFAYAMTTSGSTGLPSIVRVTHASIVPNLLDLKNIFKLSNSDKLVHLTPLTFDPSIIEIFLSMSSGATMLTVSDELKNSPSELLSVLERNHATFLSSTPSILLHRWSVSQLKSTLLRKNSELRILLLGGEPLPSLQTMSKMKHPENHTRVFNIYGITEVSCWASISEIHFKHDETFMNCNNLGTVLSNTIFQVRSEDGKNIVSEGEGILHIGSHTRICLIDGENIHDLISPVYRNTGDFVTINSNGEIILMGRQDSCIKRFGVKIYLNTLECHLKKLNFVEDCHAHFIQDSQKLHLFFTAIYNKQQLSSDAHNKMINEIWSHVRILSPKIRPDYIHYLERFEITTHGKICNKVLRKLSAIREYNGDVGVFFESIWKSQLPITRDDKLLRFVDMGGTSIMALVIFGKLTDNLGNEFPDLVGMLLENKTLSECRDYVIKQHEEMNTYPNEPSEYYKYDNTVVTATLCNSEKVGNVCHWQKCRGRTIDYDPTLSNRHQSFTNQNCHSPDSLPGSITLLHVHNLRKCIDASPTLFKYSSNDEVFVTVGSHSGVICTIQLSNNFRWNVQLPNRIEAAITIADNFKGIVGCHDGFIYCVNLLTRQVYWQFQTDNIVKCSAIICSRRKNVFVGSYDRYVYCIDIESGSLLWKQLTGSTCATPLIHDDTNAVIFVSLDSNCISLDQSNGNIRWKYRHRSPVFSSPTFINNNQIVIIADVNGKIAAVETHSGHEQWNIKISEHIFADLVAISNDTQNQFDGLLIATKSGNIYRYDFDGGYQYPRLTYTINCEVSIFASPWVEKTFFIIALENGELRTFNLNNGLPGGSFKLDGECFSSPVLHQNLIFVGCRDDHLCILKTERIQSQSNE